MGYSIQRTEINGLELIVLKDEKSGTEAAVLPEFGGLLHGLSIRNGDELFNLVDHYTSRKEAQEKLDTTFKSSKLSPFPCRIASGKYIFEGRSYQFRNKFSDGSAIHGLLYNKPFRITGESAGEDSAFLTLQYEYDQDDPGYPFNYTCELKYELLPDNLLKIQTRVTNRSKGQIPIADGWHPYFNLGGKVDDWLMHFKATALIQFDDQLIPTGELQEYDLFREARRIGTTFLDHCFTVEIANGLPVCELFNPENKLKISFFPESGYPYLQIYTPPHRNSIAIENLSAASDCFNNNMGLLLLEPGNSKSFTVFYQVTML